jgi:DNA-binding FadR family transcriptional regulator
MERLFVFTGCTYEDLMNFRELLEPGMAAQAARRASPEDVAAMRGLLDQSIQAGERGDLAERAFAEAGFHVALARATHNELVAAVGAGMRGILQRSIDAQSRVGTDVEGHKHHRRICEAVAQGNAELAEAVMEEHLAYTRASIVRAADELSGVLR